MVHLLDGVAAESGGVVDHDVEPAAGGGGLVDHGARGVMVGQIDLPENRLAAFGLDQAEGFLAMCGGAGGNDDDGAFAREGDREARPMPWPEPVTIATLLVRRVPMGSIAIEFANCVEIGASFHAKLDRQMFASGRARATRHRAIQSPDQPGAGLGSAVRSSNRPARNRIGL